LQNDCPKKSQEIAKGRKKPPTARIADPATGVAGAACLASFYGQE
jgi:hypothetical protein